MKLYCMETPTELEPQLLEYAASIAPKEKCSRIERALNVQTRTAMAAGEILLAYALNDAFGFEVDANKRTRLPGGKPALCTEDYHFNISHSGPFVFVGVDTAPLGVDIQRHKAIDDELVKKVLDEAELAIWEETDDSLSYFFSCWTKKESILKWHGIGLTGSLKTPPILPENVSVFNVAAPENHSAAACGSSEPVLFTVSLGQISHSQLQRS